jgi:non-heme chloroperoxidase
VVLAGFALGTGEVTRYLAVHGSARVRAAVLAAPLPPFLLKTSDSPDGIDGSVFDRMTARIAADRPAAMKDFTDDSYNIDLLPYRATGERLPVFLRDARSLVMAGGPHAIIWTHADEVNQAMLEFIGGLR